MSAAAWRMPILALAAVLVAAGPASACRGSRSPAEQAALWLAWKPASDATVEVEVVETRQLPGGGWRASGRTTGVLPDDVTPRTFDFGEAERVISSCGPLFAPATTGETWTLYLTRRDGAWLVGAFLPTDLVLESQGFVALHARPKPAPDLTPTSTPTPTSPLDGPSIGHHPK